MKKITNIASMMMLLCIMLVSIVSCKKDEDEGKLPNISFKTGSGYTSADATVDTNATVKIGINASKSEDKDVLTKFTITKSVNSGAATEVYSENLSGSKGDNYSYDYSFSAGSTAQTEKYTFTVVNRDGLINNVSLTLTVK